MRGRDACDEADKTFSSNFTRRRSLSLRRDIPLWLLCRAPLLQASWAVFSRKNNRRFSCGQNYWEPSGGTGRNRCTVCQRKTRRRHCPHIYSLCLPCFLREAKIILINEKSVNVCVIGRSVQATKRSVLSIDCHARKKRGLAMTFTSSANRSFPSNIHRSRARSRGLR